MQKLPNIYAHSILFYLLGRIFGRSYIRTHSSSSKVLHLSLFLLLWSALHQLCPLLQLWWNMATGFRHLMYVQIYIGPQKYRCSKRCKCTYLHVSFVHLIMEQNVHFLMSVRWAALNRNGIDLVVPGSSYRTWQLCGMIPSQHVASMLDWGLISTGGSASPLWKVNSCWHRGSLLQGALNGSISEQGSKGTALALTMLQRSRWSLIILWHHLYFF